MTFEEHLKKYLTDDEIKNLVDSLFRKDKHAVLLNTRKMDKETFLSLYPNVKRHPIVDNAFIYDKDEYQLGKSIYHELGCFYIQEPSAMVVSSILNAKEDEYILDMCAAPGGKSIQSSFLMNNTGIIISNDLSRSRTSAIVENIERLGIANIIVTNNDFEKVYENYLNTFDKIILDAPCSGSGMFRKDENVKDDWTHEKVLKFADIQKSLIDIAYKMLKQGGKMVYSTCSFSFEEDEEVIEYLLSKSDAKVIELNYEGFYQAKSKALGYHLMPTHFEGEGHYLCLVEKPGILSKTNFDKKISNKTISNFDKNCSLSISKFGDSYFGTPENVSLKKLNVIRMGTRLGEETKGIFKPDFHYSRVISSYETETSLNSIDLYQYVEGNVINCKDDSNGYVLLKFNNIPVSFGKISNYLIKNHYPKHFRKKIK